MGASKPHVAFVLGGAECVWADLASAQRICLPHIIIAVNDIGCDYPGRIDHWVSYHSDFLTRWAAVRAGKGLSPAVFYWAGKGGPTHKAPAGTQTIPVMGGSSGLLATQVALQQKASHVVLCGVPLDPAMRHYHDAKRGQPWTEANKYHRHWQDAVHMFNDRVRSMSGWTEKLLGRPDRKWLEK